MTPSALRWLKLGLALVVPLLLYAVLAERASWRPRTFTFPGVGCAAYPINGQWLCSFGSDRLEMRDAHSLRLVWSHAVRNSKISGVLRALAFSHDSQQLSSQEKEKR